KNAMIPVITFFALTIADILAGSIVVEQVFSVPGLGRALVAAISNRDYPMVQAIMLILTGTVVILNTVVDLLYHVLDPRMKGGAA
ncbi:MAG: ABC transporter permease, partial [Lachnospiraceae bacterium]|nr:ABC transporter permease [Lachnospiraceae bacterium]